jgi:hypothetical protein
MRDTINNAFTTPKRFVPSATSSDSRRRFAKRAYELFLVRGDENGHDLDDWLQAEQELLDAARSHGPDIKGRAAAGKHSA